MLKSLGVFKDFSDNSLKSVFDVGDNKIIEMSLLSTKEKTDIVCAPTHHFCNLGCKMCHLTNKGLNKKMIPIKAEDFIEALVKTLTKQNSFKKNLKRISKKEQLLISFMGVGEPLLNLKLIKEIHEKENYFKTILGYKEINYAVSTMMPNDNILKLTEMVDKDNIPLKVHFSLHTPIEEKRKDLIPAARISIEEALIYLSKYREVAQNNSIIMNSYQKLHRTNDPIEIHYTLIKNVNDGKKELKLLCELLDKYKISIKFIRFNPINDLKISSNEDLWIKTINEAVPGLRVKTYTPPGKEIGSSCGEFTKHYYHHEIETKKELKEFEEWKTKHQIF